MDWGGGLGRVSVPRDPHCSSLETHAARLLQFYRKRLRAQHASTGRSRADTDPNARGGGTMFIG